MKKIYSSLYLLGFGALALSSCAYYNTFFNTKKYYKEALTEHNKRKGDESTPAEREKFDKTIQQASKVLQLYPDSKYIDDSLMILGECFYYLEQYQKAERKFRELLELYPNSNYLDEARLWLAKTHLRLGQFEVATGELQKLIQNAKEKSIRQRAQYWLGESFWLQHKYADAVTEYKKAAPVLKDETLQVKNYMRLGDCFANLNEQALAAENLRRAGKRTKDPDLRFQINLALGKALSEAQQHEAAIRVFADLIENFYLNKDVGLAKLELANTLLKSNQDEKALDWYYAIIEDHPRSSASAGAYIALGDYEQKVKHNYKTAEENYKKSTEQGSRDDLRAANIRLSEIQKLIKLEDEIAKLTQQINASTHDAGQESVAAQPTNRTDGGGEQSAADDSSKAVAQQLSPQAVDSLKSVLAKKKFALAELFLFDYDQPDSAMNQYVEILGINKDPEDRALAFYALSYIFDQIIPQPTLRDSLYQILAKKYEHLPQGREAAKRLGLPVKKEPLNPIASSLEKAEELLLEQNQPVSAISQYQTLVKDDVESDRKAQALYAIGWIYENRLQDNRKALEYYQRLVTDLPTSVYAKNVRKKVQGVEAAQKKAAAEADSAVSTAKAEPATAPATTPTVADTSSGEQLKSNQSVSGNTNNSQTVDSQKNDRLQKLREAEIKELGLDNPKKEPTTAPDTTKQIPPR